MSIQSVNPANLVAPRPSPPQNTSQNTVSAPEKKAVTPEPPHPGSEKQLAQAVKAVNDFVNLSTSSLQFSVDKDSGKTVVKVIDMTTKEVIKQFPSEEVLAMAKALDDIKGLLVHQKA